MNNFLKKIIIFKLKKRRSVNEEKNIESILGTATSL